MVDLNSYRSDFKLAHSTPFDPVLTETVEHLQSISNLSEEKWLDLLKMNWQDYFKFRSHQRRISNESLENLATFFNINSDLLYTGQLDFHQLAAGVAPRQAHIPEKYLEAAHSRFRSTTTSIDFLESRYGWRLRQDVLKKFGLFESHIQDPFAPVSIKLMTDMTEYLYQRQFRAEDFFQMGLYSYEGNREGLLAKIYSELNSVQEAFEVLFTQIMPLFEHNCHYSHEYLDDDQCVVTVKTNPDVAADMRVKSVGNVHICQVKAGIGASTALYFNRHLPTITHTHCEHRGDEACRFVVDFTTCTPRN